MKDFVRNKFTDKAQKYLQLKMEREAMQAQIEL